jgi:hypothetical protein
MRRSSTKMIRSRETNKQTGKNPGARVPQPLEVLEHYGDSPWNVVLHEMLALTKMNWNTAVFAVNEPITVAFSKRAGQILAELPPHGIEPRQ